MLASAIADRILEILYANATILEFFYLLISLFTYLHVTRDLL